MKLLKEMYSGVGGLDNYDRAIEMINSAVEHHNRNDNFAAIADVDSLIQFLKGQYHDFTPGLEQTVRDIIADETDSGYDDEAMDAGPGFDSAEDLEKAKFDDTFQGFGREEEEETSGEKIQRMRDETRQVLDDSRKRKMARKYAIHGPSRRSGRIRRRDLGKSRGTFGLEQEEERGNFKTDWNKEVERFRERRKKYESENARSGRISDRVRSRRRNTGSRSPFSVEQEEVAHMSDRRTRGDRLRSDVRQNRRGHRHSDPQRRQAQLMARKARPHVGLEQEEHKTNYDMQTTDWDKEVADFRKRRKTAEPKYARRPSRLMGRRRKSAPSSSAFGMRFESFKQFLE